jgi:hypothetical protein
MKTVQRSCSAIVFCLLILSEAFGGGPAYTRFGIGNLSNFSGSRSYAMGGTAAALIGDGFINRMNPAGLARIAYTRLSGTFEYSNYSSTDKSGTAQFARGDFGAIAIAIPISREYGITLSGEATPYSTVNYAMSRDDVQFGIASHQEFFGKGGIAQLSFGSSVSVTDQMHLGLKFNYLAGRIRNTTTLAFTDPSYQNSTIDRNSHYAGSTLTLAGIYQGFADLFSTQALRPLSLGLVVTTPASLDLREELFTTTGSAYDTTSIRYGTTDIPLSIVLGTSYVFSERYVVAADVALQDWSTAKTFGAHPEELRNSMRIAAGIEILPHKDADTYLSRTNYRAGFSYNSTYYKVAGQGIDALSLTIGLGLPIGTDSKLNLGFEVGINGTTDNGLQKDTIFRVSASVSASEMWFLKYEED